jgi:threonine aldolase
MTARPIDFRSDTVTRPSPEMRDAMARAEVGDDVYGEDPTVNRLQEVAAELLGKQAAILVPSGTMANQAAIRALTHHGDVVLIGEGAHVLRYEGGAAAAFSGLQLKSIGAGGLFDGDDVRAAMVPADHHFAPVTLVAVENTQNSAGGRIFPIEQVRRISSAARELGLALHLDGARLFNAVVATGISAQEWAAPFDSVAFCLSKGLGAPVGSLVCGSAAIVDRVHRVRKMMGGGMRQAGILAAAGLFALERNVARLAEDHTNARRFADGLASIGAEVVTPPETNMVFFRVPAAPAFVEAARAAGVLFNLVAADQVRAVTHLDLSAADVDEALERLRRATPARRTG